MDENEKNKTVKRDQLDIKIDYDNIDVVDIMDQIKRNIAAQSSEGEDAKPQPEEQPDFISKEPEPEFVPLPVSRAKSIMLKIMRPFSPLVKLLVLPVHHELMETINKLDYTNRRLDFLSDKMEKTLTKLSHEMYDSLHKTNIKIDSFNDRVNQRMDRTFDEFGKALDRTREYTKLLHNLSHNLVIEITKLKVEEESLKLKVRIMEKDFEFLSKKEKAVEEQVFK